MSDKKNKFNMPPMSGERIEVDGVYTDEWGHEQKLERSRIFPSDQQLGDTEWELQELDYDNHHEGETDPRLIPKKPEGGHFIKP